VLVGSGRSARLGGNEPRRELHKRELSQLSSLTQPCQPLSEERNELTCKPVARLCDLLERPQSGRRESLFG
jgi:hypothetical protein